MGLPFGDGHSRTDDTDELLHFLEKGRSVMECLGVSYPCVPHASSDLPPGIPTSAAAAT